MADADHRGRACGRSRPPLRGRRRQVGQAVEAGGLGVMNGSYTQHPPMCAMSRRNQHIAEQLEVAPQIRMVMLT
jgi:hypothetical protein